MRSTTNRAGKRAAVIPFNPLADQVARDFSRLPLHLQETYAHTIRLLADALDAKKRSDRSNRSQSVKRGRLHNIAKPVITIDSDPTQPGA